MEGHYENMVILEGDRFFSLTMSVSAFESTAGIWLGGWCAIFFLRNQSIRTGVQIIHVDRAVIIGSIPCSACVAVTTGDVMRQSNNEKHYK